MTSASKAAPQASDVATYQARVAEVYGDKAVVEIDGRRFLVEPLAPGQPFPAAVGANIQVVGRQQGNVLIPRRIVLPSGAVVEAPPATDKSAPTEKDRTIEGQLATLGIDVTGRPYRRRNYTVVAGRAKDGRSVIASFDHNMRLVELEDAEHRHIHPNSPQACPRRRSQSCWPSRDIRQFAYSIRAAFASCTPCPARTVSAWSCTSIAAATFSSVSGSDEAFAAIALRSNA